MQSGEVFKAMFVNDGSDALSELVKHRQSRKPAWISEWEEQQQLKKGKDASKSPGSSKS